MTGDQEASLRPWRAGEAALLTAICDDPEVAFRTPFPSPFAEAFAQTFVDGREGYLDLAIADGSDVPVGLVSLNLRTRSASYVVSSTARGRGYATGALTALCRLAREELGLEAVVLEIEPGNLASEVVARRCGFRPAGTPLEEVEDKGRRYSLAVWERAL